MHVGDPGTEQFTIRVMENERVIDTHPIHDPFIHCTVRPRGWRVALAVLRGKYEITVNVSGTRDANRVVMSTDYDHLVERGPLIDKVERSRSEWERMSEENRCAETWAGLH